MQLSSAVAIAWLAMAWARPAYPAEEPAAAITESPAPEPKLQLAPVRIQPNFGGSINYILRRDTYPGGTTSKSQNLAVAVNAGVNVNSFFWQPWFAQVNGGLGVSTYLNDSNYNTASGSSSNKTVSTLTTGKAGLDIVPYTRFPFNAFYEKSDNRQNTGYGLANAATQTTRFGLSQHYSTLSGQSSASVNYSQNRSENERYGIDRQKQAGLNYRTSITPNQLLTMSGYRIHNEHLGSNQDTLSNTFTGTYSIRPSASLNVENMVSANTTSYRLAQQTNSEDRSAQLSSFATWMSDERPLTLTSNVRVSQIDNTSANGALKQSRANVSLGANYQMSRQVRTFGSASVNLYEDQIAGTQSTSSSQSAGAEFRSDPVKLGSFGYETNASGTISNSNSSAGSSQTGTLTAGHIIRRSSSSGRVLFASHASQSATATKSTLNPVSTHINHGGSLSWTIAGEDGTSTVQLTANDSRRMSTPRNFFQIVNLQATRAQSMSRNQSLSGNLTIQATRSGTENAASTPTTITSSAAVSYAHARAFGVPRLTFNSDLRIYGDRLPLSPQPHRRESRSWNNRLGYSIGRTTASLDAYFSQSNDATYKTLMFRLSRTF